jgi:hypothetical protein
LGHHSAGKLNGKLRRPSPQFQAFHEVVEKVVSLLVRLKEKWIADQTPHSHVLIEKIDLTLEHIQQNK